MSTLSVGDLQGLAVNSNVVTVPTGHTLNVTDTAGLQIGGSAITQGKILQVVSTTKVDAFIMSSGGFTDVTGLSATITPTSATSKILVIASVSISAQTGYNAYLNLVRNSTNISQSTGGTSNMTKTITAGIFWFHPTVVFEDSPATTSATTYKIQIRAENSGQGVSINRRYDTAAYGSTSSITVMEVSA